MRPRPAAALTALLIACSSAPSTPPCRAPPHHAPPVMTLDRLIGWLSGSRIRYELTERAGSAPGFGSFFRAGIPPALAPLDRRLLHRRLAEADAAVGEAREAALVEAVLVDRRGGAAWARYLAALARDGQSVYPAPLLPPGTVVIDEDGAELLFPSGQREWAFYLGCKAAARLEPGFRAQLGGTATDAYRWSVGEEVGCLRILAEATRRAADDGRVPRGLTAHLLAAQAADVLAGYGRAS